MWPVTLLRLVAGVPIAFPSSFHLEDSDALTSLLSSVQPPDTSLIIEHTVKRAEDSKTQGREGIRDETAENKTGDEHAHRGKYLVLHTPEIVQKLYSSSTKNAYQGSETIVPHDERAKKAQGEIIHEIPDRTINVLLNNLVTAKGNNIVRPVSNRREYGLKDPLDCLDRCIWRFTWHGLGTWCDSNPRHQQGWGKDHHLNRTQC
jgi:hypothetical protein